MTQFILDNQSAANRAIWSAGSQVVIPSKAPPQAYELSDSTAIFIRRCELRGDKLRVTAVDEQGEQALKKALVPPQRHNRGLLPHNSNGTFRDELALKEVIEPVSPAPKPVETLSSEVFGGGAVGSEPQPEAPVSEAPKAPERRRRRG